jgi:hypothetical protein
MNLATNQITELVIGDTVEAQTPTHLWPWHMAARRSIANGSV